MQVVYQPIRPPRQNREFWRRFSHPGLRQGNQADKYSQNLTWSWEQRYGDIEVARTAKGASFCQRAVEDVLSMSRTCTGNETACAMIRLCADAAKNRLATLKENGYEKKSERILDLLLADRQGAQNGRPSKSKVLVSTIQRELGRTERSSHPASDLGCNEEGGWRDERWPEREMAVRMDTSLAKAKAGGHTPRGTAQLGLGRVGEAQGACGPWVEFGCTGERECGSGGVFIGKRTEAYVERGRQTRNSSLVACGVRYRCPKDGDELRWRARIHCVTTEAWEKVLNGRVDGVPGARTDDQVAESLLCAGNYGRMEHIGSMRCGIEQGVARQPESPASGVKMEGVDAAAAQGTAIRPYSVRGTGKWVAVGELRVGRYDRARGYMGSAVNQQRSTELRISRSGRHSATSEHDYCLWSDGPARGVQLTWGGQRVREGSRSHPDPTYESERGTAFCEDNRSHPYSRSFATAHLARSTQSSHSEFYTASEPQGPTPPQRLAFNKRKQHSHNLTKCAFSIPTPSEKVGGGLKCLPLGPEPQVQFFGQAGQQQERFSKTSQAGGYVVYAC
ncbi:hypothetical protein DFH08DRAFT_826792 [Mycena albidolilacea]|uniref:Uncharacterized protein n=1 Tax=Mycena albidolilacea TaxID=1033008 RepID=A0AAD6Z0I5_9AGAR|nr:hypothetical protein DFH08DRAFT_826792 [Mycena albidolilacea]